MKKIINARIAVIVFVFYAVCVTGVFGQENNTYFFSYTKTDMHETYTWNWAYPAYYVHYTIAAVFELDKVIPADDMIPLEKSIIKCLMHSNKAQLTIPKFSDNKDLWITFSPLSPGNGKAGVNILILSNYSFKQDRIVEGDDMADAYAVLLYIYGKKLVKSTNVFSAENEKELIQKGNLNNLADMYIYDEKDDNDRKIEGLLRKAIADNNKAGSRCISSLTLAEYYIIKNDFNKAAEQLQKTTALLDGLDEKMKSSIGMAVDVVAGILKLAKSVATDKPFLEASFEGVFGK